MSHLRTVLATVVVATLVVAVALPAASAPGDPVLAGHRTKASGYSTILQSRSTGATLRLINTRSSGGLALDLRTQSGPALAVPNSARIHNLNADYLDGRNANALIRLAGCDDDDLVGKSCTFTIEAPRPGYVAVVGSADVILLSYAPDPASVQCSFRNETLDDPASTGRFWHGHPGDLATCSTNGHFVLPAAGSYEFRFKVSGYADTVAHMSAEGIYIPFDGSGGTP